MPRLLRSVVPIVALIGAGLGCSSAPKAEEVQVVLALATVPPDVACVRITATGPGRGAVRELGVTAGAMINEAFSGLPLGTVIFKGEAFSGDCASVTKSTIAGWASEPEAVAIVLGRQTTVSMTLNRNGRARLNVDFSDEPTCTAAGASCISSSECCSKSCRTGHCQPDDDAGVEDAS